MQNLLVISSDKLYLLNMYTQIAWRQLREWLKPVWRWRPSQRTALLGGSLLAIGMILVGATLLDDVVANIETRDRIYQETESGQTAAPDLPDSLIWFGDKGSYGDKVTMLFFWNPSCITCNKSYTQSNIWRSRYGSYGLKIISIMNARYDFETDPDYIAGMLKLHNIKSPSAYDVEYELEDAISEASQTFQVSQDSAIVLVDKDKKIRHVDVDSTSLYNTELAIQGLLNEAGVKDKFPRPVGQRNDTSTITGGLYFGDFSETKKSFAGSPEFSLDKTTYGGEDSASSLSPGQWSLGGTWSGAEQYIKSISSGYFSTLFSGTKVYIVAESPKPDFAGVTINGEIKARADEVGKDGLIKISGPKIYQLVNAKKPLKNAQLTIGLPDGAKLYHLLVLSD